MKKSIPVLFVLFLLISCLPQANNLSIDAPTATVAFSATVPLLPTSTSTPTPLPAATASPTPTASPTATASPTPTPILFPVGNGTPLPNLPYEKITTENVQRLREIARYGYPYLNSYRLTADGKTIVVGTTAGIEFYDAVTHQKTGEIAIDRLRNFDVTPDGRFILAHVDDSLMVWTADGNKVREFALEFEQDVFGELPFMAISPDGSLIAVQQKKQNWQDFSKVEVYRVSDGTLLDIVRGDGVLFSPDGKYLATQLDGLWLYPLEQLGEGWENRLPKQSLPWCPGVNERCTLVFSPDGILAAVVGTEWVKIYRVENRELVRHVSGFPADNYILPTVQFSSDGSKLLVQTPIERYMDQFKFRVIVVNIADGKWLTNVEYLVENYSDYVYLAQGEVKMFAWKANGALLPRYWYRGALLEVDDSGQVVLAGARRLCRNDVCQDLGEDRVAGWVDGRIQVLQVQKSSKHKGVLEAPAGETPILILEKNLENLTFYDGIWIANYSVSFYSFWITLYGSKGRQHTFSNSSIDVLLIDKDGIFLSI